jgi:PAS domain S-box-containing protein
MKAEAGSQCIPDILEQVSDAFVALDRDWRYTHVNEKAAQLFGRRREDLLGKHIWTEFPEGVGQPFHRAYERALAEQILIQLEEYYPPYDRWFENRIHPSPQGLAIFFHDITDRKRAEALVAGQNRILELIATGVPLPATLDALLRFLEAQSPGMLCSILLLDADGGHVRHGAAPSLPAAFTRAIDGEPIGPVAGSCGTAAWRREAVFVADIATDPLWAGYRDVALGFGLRACWSTPICDAQERVLGTFAIYYREPGLPTPRHRELIGVATSR